MFPVPVVFVSSTREDLDDARTEIRNNLPRMDILFRGMEVFGSQARRPIDVIRSELVGCDLLVGILGHRYGAEDPDTGMSYTELEYCEAIKRRIPVRMFVADSRLPIQSGHVENDTKRAKLAAFKARILKEHTPETFTTAEDLATKIAHSLRGYLAEVSPFRAELIAATNTLNESDLRNIRALYSKDEKIAEAACVALASSGTRQPLEHYYAAIRTTTSAALRKAAFDALIHLPYRCIRVDQILEELLLDEARPELRLSAAAVLCHRARPAEAKISDSLLRAILSRADLALEPDPQVREEAAHTLSKVAMRRPGDWMACQQRLEILYRSDPSPEVRERSGISLKDMGVDLDTVRERA